MGEHELIDFSQYIESMKDYQWPSHREFNYDFMEGLGYVANKSANWVFPTIQDFKGWQINPKDILDFGSLDDNGHVWDNQGPLAYIVTWAVIALIFTVMGIAWCIYQKCCCCCNKRSSWSKKASASSGVIGNLEPDEGECKLNRGCRISSGVFMGIWLLLFFGALFCTFPTNVQVRNAILDLPSDLRLVIHDARQYKDITQGQIDGLFINAYGNQSVILEDIACTLVPCSNSPKSSLDVDVQNNLEALENAYAQVANSPDLALQPEIQVFLESSVSPAVKQLKATLQRQRELVPDIREKLQEIGRSFRESTERIHDALNEVDDEVDEIESRLDDMEEGFQDGKDAIYWSLMGISIFFVVVFAFFFVGFVLTTLGGWVLPVRKRHGGIFTNCAILTVFIVGGLFMVSAVALFCFYGTFTQIMCESIRSLEDNEMPENETSPSLPEALSSLSLFTKQNPGDDYIIPYYPDIVQACKKGKSVYESFNLSQIFDINTLNISSQLFVPESVQDRSDQLKHLQTILLLNVQNLQNIRGNGDNEMNLELAKLESGFQNMENSLKTLNKLQIDSVVEFTRHVKHFENESFSYILGEIGECSPMYSTLNSTIELFCYKMANPIGGFWFAFMISSFLFIPLAITAFISVYTNSKFD